MKKYPVYNMQGEKVKDVNLNPAVFGVQPKESVVHQVAVAQMANARRPIAHTKDRSEVRGGGAKPWRQKGTGQARHGSTRSPIWVGGGVTFGPTKDRNFSQKVNKKQKTKALFMCLSDKVNPESAGLIVLDKLSISDGKTREIVDVIKNLASALNLKEIRKKKLSSSAKATADKETKETKETKKFEVKENTNKKFDIKKYKLSLLIVLPKSDKKALNATRNLIGIKITTADSLNVVDLLKYKNVLMLEDGLRVIDKTYLKK